MTVSALPYYLLLTFRLILPPKDGEHHRQSGMLHVQNGMSESHSIAFPVAPQPWEEIRPYGVFWEINQEKHWITAGCISKDGPLRDCEHHLVPRSYGINLVLSGSGTYHSSCTPQCILKPGMIFQRKPDLGEIIVDIAGHEPWVECYVTVDRETFYHLSGLGLVCADMVMKPSAAQRISAKYGTTFTSCFGTASSTVVDFLPQQQRIRRFTGKSFTRCRRHHHAEQSIN